MGEGKKKDGGTGLVFKISAIGVETPRLHSPYAFDRFGGKKLTGD